MIQGTAAPAAAPSAAAQSPALPAVPAAPRGPASVVVTNADGTTQTLAIPVTRQDVENIRSRREELSNQLSSAAGRRRRLAEELKTQPEGPARAGIEGRLVVLDTRLAQLESDIAATGRQLSAAPEGLITSEGRPVGGDIPDNVMALSATFTIFVLFPIAFALARNLWKRGNRPQPAAALPPEAGQRLERVEQGIEAIAIEVERISEGQRFVTKLLAEGVQGTKLPAGKVGEEARV